MLCIIAKLDEASTEKLQSLQEAALQLGAAERPVHGHITLASYIGDDEAGFMEHCRAVLQIVCAFPVRYRSLEVLAATSLIAAMPERAGTLSELHNSLAERYREDLNQWSQADTWKPHTTLVVEPNRDLEELCGRMADDFQPFTAIVSKIEFSRVTETGYEIVDTLDLKPAWCLYILRCGDGSLYTGITNDVERRLEAHRRGRGAKYTRGRGPLELSYREVCGSYSEALKREIQVKALPRAKKLQLIDSFFLTKSP